MVGGSSRIPKEVSIIEHFFNQTPNRPIEKKNDISPLNTDEAVAYGAYKQQSIVI